MKRFSRQSASRTLLCALWAAGIIYGLAELTAYTNTSAEVAPQPDRWPQDAAVPRPSDRPAMVLALHPRCACSRATVEELARLLAQVPARPRVEILLYQPAGFTGSWGETDLAIRARSLPGVTVRPDVEGREAERFRLLVSGHTAVYAADGRLMFSGGITRARGHAGDNAGRAAIISLLSNQQTTVSQTPVFGCSIRNQS